MKTFELSPQHTITVPETARVLAFEATEADKERMAIDIRLQEIDELATKPRTMRGLLLGDQDTIAYVQGLEDEADTLRVQLSGLE